MNTSQFKIMKICSFVGVKEMGFLINFDEIRFIRRVFARKMNESVRKKYRSVPRIEIGCVRKHHSLVCFRDFSGKVVGVSCAFEW